MEPKPTQAWDALPFHRHGLIQASAGTGKTFTIENLVVRILTRPEERVDLENILIVTYTEKATEELRFRIRKRLEEKLSGHDQLPGPVRAHVERCLTRFDRAAIYTIHGFCNRYLAAHAFESHCPFSSELGDALLVARDVLFTLIRTNLRENLWISSSQIRSMLTAWGCKDVQAFFDLSCRILSSFNTEAGDKVLPELGGTRAGQIRDRLLQACEIIRTKVLTTPAETHPFVSGWDRDRLKARLKIRKPTEATIAKRIRLVKELISNFPVACDAETLFCWITAEVWKDARGTTGVAGCFVVGECSIEQLSEALPVHNGVSFGEFVKHVQAVVDCACALRYEVLARFLRGASALVRERRARDGIITYDDMVFDMYCSLRSPYSELNKILRRQFRYGIIDEFQDTSAHQWAIFRRIFVDNDDRPPGQEGRLYVVGDPKQSIFSFQGSNVNTYLDAIDSLAAAGAQAVPLGTNYRSTSPMVEACNRLFSCDSGDPERDWFASGKSRITYEPVLSGTTVADAICSGDVPLALRKPVTFLDVSEPERNGRAPGENSGANKGTKAAKSGVLAEWICSLIRYLTTAERGETPIRIPTEKSAPSSDAVAYRNIALGDICILVERHGEAKPIMKLFRRNGVPYTKQRNTGLFASDECLHLLAVLEAIDKSDDAVAVKKALLTRFFGWRPADIGEAFEAVSDRWSEATKLLRRLSDLRGRKQWGTLFAELFRSTGLFSRVANDREPALRIAAYRQLRTYCLRSLIDKRITLAELVARLRLLNKGELSEAEDEDVFHRETEGDAVQILTMFSAKGLEFPIVFVVGGKGEDRPASNFYSAGNKDGGTDFWLDKDQGKEALRRVREQEIRRLYYVALTRAKYRLFVPLWDHSDEEGNVPGRDRSSASALFLSRLCCAVLAKKENEPSFSLLTAPVFPSCIDAGSKAPSSGAGLFSQGVAIGEWRGENGSEVAPPAGRGTILESYSGMVRMAGKLGIRTNPGADEDHGVSGPQAADAPVEQESDVLVSSAETGDALHAILEEADFAEWAQAACIDKLIEPGSAAALLVERSLGARGIIKGDGNDGTRKRRAAELARNSLLAAIEDPCGKGTIALAALKKAERMSEAEFYFTFDKNGKPFPPAGADPGGWVLGFIDFLFRTGDRYYLLDWKSNRIASGVYNRETIGENMEAHRYDVQYKVYSLALHNWLAQRVPSYDPARHLGGIIYVYLRGTSPGLGSGIWSIHPSREDLETVWPAEIEKRLSQRLRAAPGGRL